MVQIVSPESLPNPATQKIHKFNNLSTVILSQVIVLYVKIKNKKVYFQITSFCPMKAKFQ